jgi:phage head maturation protease
MTIKKLYADITKTEALDDGTVKVWGYASSEAEDSDGETITADAMKAALPDYMKWANVREMHQPKAAGTAIEAEVQDDGRTWFGAHIIDSEAVKKVNAGVYKGFSVGGKVTGRDELNKSVITGIKLVEVSLVDRPANPEAVFTVVKAETLEEPAAAPSAIDQLAELLNKGEVTAERLLELAKTPAAPGQDDATKAADAEDLEKGMWSVQDFAGVLSTIGWICRDAQCEADYEGDGSAVPAALRAWVAQGIQIFKDMAAEETTELLADLKAAAGDVDVIELAARGQDLAKAGARFSKATKDSLGAIHKAAKECCDHLDKLGYAGADEEEGEDAGKAATPDDLAKVAGDLDVAKADLVKLAAERDELVKRVKELESQPAPGKALLKAVGKGGDVVDPDKQTNLEIVKDARGETNEVASLIKTIHAQGGARLA